MPKITEEVDPMDKEDSDYGPLLKALTREVPKTSTQVERLKANCKDLIEHFKEKGLDNLVSEVEKLQEKVAEYEVVIENERKKLNEAFYVDNQLKTAEAIRMIMDLNDKIESMRKKSEKDYKKDIQEAALARLNRELAELSGLRNALASRLDVFKNDFHQADTKIHNNVSSFVQHADEVFEKYQLQTVLSHEEIGVYKKGMDSIKHYLDDADQKKLTGQVTSIESDRKVVYEEEKMVAELEKAKEKLSKKLDMNRDKLEDLQKEIDEMNKLLMTTKGEIESKEISGQKIEETKEDIKNVEEVIKKKSDEKDKIARENIILKKEIKQIESSPSSTNTLQNGGSKKIVSKESEKTNLEEGQRPRLDM